MIAGEVIGDANLVPHWPGAAWLITLALTSQVLGWMLIGSSLPRLPAALTSVILTIQPVGSVALAAAIFGESPTALQLVGVATVLAGLLIVTYRVRGRLASIRRGRPGGGEPEPGYAIAGARGSRASAASMSASENSGSSSRPARKAS